MGCETLVMQMRLFVTLLTPILVGSSTAMAGIVPHLLYGKRITGKVLDAETGKPIAGAHIAFLWESTIIPKGFTGHNSRDICYHAAAVESDVTGRFESAAWKRWSTYDVNNAQARALVYAPGYKPLQRLTHDLDSDKLTTEIYTLEPFKGTEGQRLNDLFYGLANQACSYGGDSQKSLYPMLRAIYYEARGLSVAPNRRPSLRSFGTMAANAAMAADPEGPANLEEIEKFISENLK